MSVQTVKFGKREFVIVPKRDFERLQRRADLQDQQDRGDITEVKRRRKEPSVSLAAVRKRLGL